MDKALKFIYCRPLNYSCCVTAVWKGKPYKMQNNIMGYVTERPTRKRKWSSSAPKATPSCHDWKREVGHNKFTSALSQIKGYQHTDLKPNNTKNGLLWIWGIMDTALCQNQTYNCETSTSVLTRSTLKQGIYNKRCFIGYVLQFSLPFLNLENTSTATSTSWIVSQRCKMNSPAQTAKQLDCVITVFGSEPNTSLVTQIFETTQSRDWRSSAWAGGISVKLRFSVSMV